MSDADRIPGTRVPESPIHRASLWLEEARFPGERDAKPRMTERVDLENIIAVTGLPVTPEQLNEATSFYANNFRDVMFGPGPGVEMVTVTAQGPVRLIDLLASVWQDGFLHGAATATGLHGLSHAERDAADA